MRLTNGRTGEVIELDRAACRLSKLRSRVFAWANAMHHVLQGVNVRKVMITLTYAGVGDWQAGHIRQYMRRIRKRCGPRLLAYAWVAELQERGAVHYHILLVCKRGTFIPMPDKSGMWSHGSSKIETARTVFYIAKYVGKEYQKMGVFPRGLRMWAVWIAKDVIGAGERFIFRLSAYPRWLRDLVRDELIGGCRELPKRVIGGGWMWAGRVVHSPWLPTLAVGATARMASDWVDFRISKCLEALALAKRRADVRAWAA